MSRIETLLTLVSAGVLLGSLASWLGPSDRPPTASRDYREALEVARSEIEALSGLSSDEIARLLPPGEQVAVIPGSLLAERQSAGAVSISGRRVAWNGACSGLETSPGDACPGLYRRIERIDGAYRVTIVVAWPDPAGRDDRPLRRVDLQSRLG